MRFTPRILNNGKDSWNVFRTLLRAADGQELSSTPKTMSDGKTTRNAQSSKNFLYNLHKRLVRRGPIGRCTFLPKCAVTEHHSSKVCKIRPTYALEHILKVRRVCVSAAGARETGCTNEQPGSRDPVPDVQETSVVGT